MSTIMPQSELMRNAVRYISEQLKETGKPVKTLIQEAAIRFNLSPKETDFLEQFLKEAQLEED